MCVALDPRRILGGELQLDRWCAADVKPGNTFANEIDMEFLTAESCGDPHVSFDEDALLGGKSQRRSDTQATFPSLGTRDDTPEPDSANRSIIR